MAEPHKLGKPRRVQIRVANAAGNPVRVNPKDFVVQILIDDSLAKIPYVINEVEYPSIVGAYSAIVQTTMLGDWQVFVSHPVYKKAGVYDVFSVTRNGMDDLALASAVAAVGTLSDVNVVKWNGSTVNNLSSAGNVPVNIAEWLTLVPNPLVSGKVDANVASVAGSVGSVTGNVGGDIQGKVLGSGASAITGTGTRADVRAWNGSAPSDLSAGDVSVNVNQWTSALVAAPDAGGLIKTNLYAWRDSTPNALVQARVDSVQQLRTATAQGGTSTSVTLDAGASATDNLYRYQFVWILAGTGAGQTRFITFYNGTTKVAVVSQPWTGGTPDNTSVFALVPFSAPGVDGIATVGNIPANVTQWNGSSPNSLVSGNVPANVKAVTAGALASESIASVSGSIVGDLQGKVLGGGASALGGVGVQSDVRQWLGSAPAGLAASGTLQADVELWKNVAPNALIAGRVDANAQVVGDKVGYALTAAEENAIADAILKRDLSNVEPAGQHTLAGGLQKLTCKVVLSADGTTLTIYRSNGVVSFTQTTTTDANANPVTSVA